MEHRPSQKDENGEVRLVQSVRGFAYARTSPNIHHPLSNFFYPRLLLKRTSQAILAGIGLAGVGLAGRFFFFRIFFAVSAEEPPSVLRYLFGCTFQV